MGDGRTIARFPKEWKQQMQLVEQHIIERRDPRFAHIDEAAYELRQAFIFQGRYIPYEEMDPRCRRQPKNWLPI
jgi:hypothetical protein